LLKAKKGFSLVEAIIVLMIAMILVAVGLVVFKDNNKHKKAQTPASNNPVSSQSSSQYVGWKQATLKYEKLSFDYPSDWKLLSNEADPEGTENAVCVHPGSDTALLATPNNESMTINTGETCGAVTETQIASMPITVLGKSEYISLLDDDAPSSDNGQPTEACLSTASTSLLGVPSKNIFLNADIHTSESSPPVNFFCFKNEPANSTHGSVHASVTAMEDDPNFATAKLILESLKY
jgi:hypothetical protein